ncbi:hypothetical protein [Microbacterium maritypicum]
MEDYLAPFIELIDRKPADLSNDERDSLEYFYASTNLAEGLPPDTPPRSWCLMAQNVGRIVHMLGRPPRPGDPGATPVILRWIAEQHGAPLNGYQRARLAALPAMGDGI